MLKALVVHNRYIHPGGEDEVVAAETDLLRRHGHEVVEYIEDNRRIDSMSRLRLAARTLWSEESRRRLAELIRKETPDIAHFHNTFPLISPAAYYACRDAGVAVVQTLHNYRLVCPNSLLLRGGRPCDLCLGRTLPWPGVRYACYHESRVQTAVIGGMLAVHHWLGTWDDLVDVYVTLTDFARDILIRSGRSPSKIRVKPNFHSPDQGPGDGRDGSVLYVGRLTEDKGIEVLLSAWDRLGGRWPLKILGDGPLRARVQDAARRIPNVEWLGRRPRVEVIERMKRSVLLVVPSLSYEGFPMIIPEAFSAGLPALVSGHGALREIVEDGVTGVFAEPGDSEDLARRVESVLTDSPFLMRLRSAARAAFESRYSEQQNYGMLMEIYTAARSRGSGV